MTGVQTCALPIFGYITPKDKLAGRAEAILAAREAKLDAARQARKAMRKAS